MCVCLFSALSRRVGALQISIIINMVGGGGRRWGGGGGGGGRGGGGNEGRDEGVQWLRDFCVFVCSCFVCLFVFCSFFGF